MKHKYLHELFPDGGIPFPYGEEDYPDFDERDTFCMDNTLIAWLYERLRYFQDDKTCVDLNFHKFEIDGETLTQIQCIDRMIEDCKVILLFNGGSDFDDWKEENKYFEDVVDPAKDDLLKVLSKVYWAMWW